MTTPWLVMPHPATTTLAVVGHAERFPVRRIYCVGRNYEAHAREMGFTEREAPFFFMKPADAASAVLPGEVGHFPYPTLSEQVHHEAELVVAIGHGGSDIPVESAASHVWGYAVGLDMTRRDLQAQAKDKGRPWCIAKGFDGSAPIGALTPAAQWSPAPEHVISLGVNGQPRQRSQLGLMIWSVPEIIAALSKAWTLAPGDIIMTGTPEGVGPVVRGDVMVAAIDGLQPIEVKVT